MRKVQITIELPDEFDSINQLEAIVDARGQHIKQRLFEQELGHLIDQEKQSSDSVACPHCFSIVSGLDDSTRRANLVPNNQNRILGYN